MLHSFFVIFFFRFVLAVPFSKVLSSPGGDKRTAAVDEQRHRRTLRGLGNESGRRSRGGSGEGRKKENKGRTERAPASMNKARGKSGAETKARA